MSGHPANTHSGDDKGTPEYTGRVAPAGRVRGLDGKTYPASDASQQRTAAYVLALRRHGLTQSCIAARLGISQPTVSRLLREWREVA